MAGRKPQSVTAAIPDGRVAVLKALHVRLAAIVDDPATAPYVLVSVCRLVAELSKEIEALSVPEKLEDDVFASSDGVWQLHSI